MTRQRTQDLVYAFSGLTCGFLFTASIFLQSDYAFVGSLVCAALSFAYSLVDAFLSARAAKLEGELGLLLATVLPVSTFSFFSFLMAGSSYNPDPKPLWMVAVLAVSLGVIATRAGLALAPKRISSTCHDMLRF